MLHAPGPDRRGECVRSAGHRAGSRQFRQGVQGAGLLRIPRRIRRRPHAEPGRAVQRRDQVRLFPRSCHGAGGRAHRHRPLRSGATLGGRGGGDVSAFEGRGRHEGSELFPLPARPGAAFALDVSAGAALQARGAQNRARPGAAGGGEEGFDRDLFHRRAAVSRIPAALSAGAPRRDPLARRRARAGHAPGSDVLHLGAAQGTGHRRGEGRRGSCRARGVVRGGQGRGGQRALRGAGARASGAVARPAHGGALPLDLGPGAAHALGVYGQTPLSFPRCALRNRAGGGGSRRARVRAAAVGAHAGPERGGV